MSRHWLNRLIVPRFVWDFWRFKMTLTGRMLLGCIFFASFGLITIQVPIFFTYSALSALLILAFLVGLLFRPRVRLDVTLPSRVSVGESVKGRVRVTNRSRWPAFDISVGFIDLTRTLKHLDHEVSTIAIGSTDSVDLPITIEAHRRGLHQLKELRAYSSFPFHLFRSGSSRTQLPPLLVVPKFYPLTDLDVPANTRHQPGGIALTSRVGESSEYIGNRDYVPGEPVRRIDFRAWARTGQPVLREYQEEYDGYEEAPSTAGAAAGAQSASGAKAVSEREQREAMYKQIRAAQVAQRGAQRQAGQGQGWAHGRPMRAPFDGNLRTMPHHLLGTNEPARRF